MSIFQRANESFIYADAKGPNKVEVGRRPEDSALGLLQEIDQKG